MKCSGVEKREYVYDRIQCHSRQMDVDEHEICIQRNGPDNAMGNQ